MLEEVLFNINKRMGTLLDSIKEKAKVIWSFYDDTFGYATEKKNYVDSIKLERDAYIIWNMFDLHNQLKFYKILTEEEKDLIGRDNMRYIENSNEDYLSKFIK